MVAILLILTLSLVIAYWQWIRATKVTIIHKIVLLLAALSEPTVKIGIYIKDGEVPDAARLQVLTRQLEEASCELYRIETREDVQRDSDMVLSVGGDGTFLSASKRVADSGVPILGVNFGRLGFLSENRPEDVPAAVLGGKYEIEDRTMLEATVSGGNTPGDFWPYALNEVAVRRTGGAVLGINVNVNGMELPTYWADGLLVATSSGSTAYSLSAGGPICTPDSRVLIVAPIAPHNLNVRPLVVPESSYIGISVQSRDGGAAMSLDNRHLDIQAGWKIGIQMAQFSLKRVRLGGSTFVKALTSKLFWGEDIRNNR